MREKQLTEMISIVIISLIFIGGFMGVRAYQSRRDYQTYVELRKGHLSYKNWKRDRKYAIRKEHNALMKTNPMYKRAVYSGRMYR